MFEAKEYELLFDLIPSKQSEKTHTCVHKCAHAHTYTLTSLYLRTAHPRASSTILRNYKLLEARNP